MEHFFKEVIQRGSNMQGRITIKIWP